MVTTVEALQGLYSSIGGDSANVENLSTIPDLIEAIAELKSGESSTISNLLSGNLIALNVPEGTTELRTSALQGSNNLESVTLPDGLINIGDKAFLGCSSLKAINLPEGLKTIGDGAFQNCSALEVLIFPDSLESIGGDAVTLTAIKKVVLGKNVSFIGYRAFEGFGSTNLKTVELYSNMSQIDKTKTQDIFADNAGLETALLDFTNQGSTVNVPWGLFRNCTGLESATIKGPKVNLVGYTFVDCSSLANITFENVGILGINGYCFKGCDALENVDLRNCTTPAINNNGFYDSGLKEITLPAGVRLFPNSFAGTGEGLVINCEFAEGVVSGAPWGATNPVINYNYTE